MSDETVFAAALEKADPTERAAFLAAACPDPAARERVERLLAAHDQAGAFLNRPAVAPEGFPTVTQAPGDTAEPDDALAFLTPSARPDALGRIGHYEVLQVLGKGAFGIVFRAFDDVLQRVVAVKVLAPPLAATSPARKRFLREAQSSARVRHENVVQVYEVAEQPLPHIVMEFIPGETLQQRLNRLGPVDAAEVVRVGRQIAEGLAAAHAQDLIHRDIKPGNILIEGGQGRVKITDFGLARAADDASISQSGVVAGTPMFMSPEQARGDVLDARSDLFSLGSVLYQMAAGRPPFRANNTVAVLKRVAEDTPRDIREIIPETPPWLCAVIAKLHAKDPAARYQSAREVADVLADCEEQLKAGSKLKDFSRIPSLPAPPRARRRRGWVAAAAVLLPVLALTATELAGVTHLFRGQPPPPTSPEVPRRAADVLAFIRGTWTREMVVVEPKLPPDAARSFGQLTFDPVAGGTVMRGLSVDEHGRSTSLILHAYDAATDRIKSWYFTADGEVTASGAGVYDPANKSFLWMERLPDGTQTVHHLDFVDADTVRARTYDTDAASAIVYESRATYTRTGRPPAAPKPETDPKRPAEMAPLDRLVGEWRHEYTVATPGNQPKNEVQRTTARSILGGRVIETVSTNETTAATHYSLLWYDAAAKRYRQTSYLDDGQVHDTTGTWDDATKTLSFAGPDGVRFGHRTFKGDDLYEFRRAAKDPAGTVVFDATGVARRTTPRLPAAPPPATPPPPAVAPFTPGQAQAHQAAWAKHLGVPVETAAEFPGKDADQTAKMTFRLIPPGEFVMGAAPGDDLAGRAERPQHTVRLTRPFYLGVHEVTVKQFEAFAGKKESRTYETLAEVGGRGAWGLGGDPEDDERKAKFGFKAGQNWRTRPAKKSGDDHPVTCLAWADAEAFCAWLSRRDGKAYRLPTEAEWEFACRAGTTTRYWFGDAPDRTQANLGQANLGVVRVGGFPANPFGLRETHGNVGEWVRDAPRDYTPAAATDPVGTGADRVYRGGQWFCKETSPVGRSSDRSNRYPADRPVVYAGFRVALDLGPPPKAAPAPPKAAPVGPPAAVAPFDGDAARAHQEAWAKHLGVPVETASAAGGVALRLIPPGEFLMGAEPADTVKKNHVERPQHPVRLTRPFYLGAHEVTVGQFRRFADEAGYKTKAEVDDAGAWGIVGTTDTKFGSKPGLNWRTRPDKTATDDHPVTCLAWADAEAFCAWLSKTDGKAYRLPTEAEWEFACRAGTTTRYWFGEDFDRSKANLERASPVPRKVRFYPPNPFGLYEVHGNVGEWCQDPPREYAADPAADPVGAGTLRTYRGGQWFCKEGSGVGRSSDRSNRHPPDRPIIYAGFRVLCEVGAPAAAPGGAPEVAPPPRAKG